MPPMPRNAALITATLLIVAGATADPPATQPAEARGPTSRPAPESATSASSGALAGPKVEPEAIGRADGGLEAGGAARRPEIPPRRWLALVREIDLTPEQAREVRKIVEALGRERRAFQREHGSELRRLQKQVREVRAGNAEPAANLRERFRTLREKQPKVEAYQQQVWAMFTPEQQTRMQGLIDRERDAMKRRREMRRERDLDDATRRRLEFLRSRVVR